MCIHNGGHETVVAEPLVAEPLPLRCSSRWDQGEFNRISRKGWAPSKLEGLSDPRLFWAYEKRVVGGVLPLSLFCGGHNYFVSRVGDRASPQPRTYTALLLL